MREEATQRVSVCVCLPPPQMSIAIGQQQHCISHSAVLAALPHMLCPPRPAFRPASSAAAAAPPSPPSPPPSPPPPSSRLLPVAYAEQGQ